MKKIILAVSVFTVMVVVFGIPDLAMAGFVCEQDFECVDGVACTDDECVGGECQNTPDDGQCNDGVDCTTDTCDEFTGCEHITDDGQCDDGIDCTRDRCTDSGCMNEPQTSQCNDGIDCTRNECSPTEGCRFIPRDGLCEDEFSCTRDTCDETQGCINQPDDGRCNDDVDCTDDTCDPNDPSAVTGGCVYAPDDGQCNDDVDCTNDTCDQTQGCMNEPDDSLCDDSSVCTDDSCDPATGCVNTPDCLADPSCDLGSGPGCSAIGGVDAETIMAGSCFEGKIGTTGVSGVNPNGKPAKDSDGDGCTDSLEKCINSSLVGYCTDVDVNDCDSDPGDDGEDILYTPGAKEGRKQSQQYFQVVFQSGPCSISECSDQMDNDGDGKTDYGKDPQCASFSDDNESTAGEQ